MGNVIPLPGDEDQTQSEPNTDAQVVKFETPELRKSSSISSLGSKGKELSKRISQTFSIVKQGTARWSLKKEGHEVACGKYEQDAIFAVFARCKHCAFPRSDHNGQEQIKSNISKSLSTHATYPERSEIPARRWKLKCEHYEPVEFTHQVVLDNDMSVNPNGWADPQDPKKIFEEIRARTSYAGEVLFDEVTHRPLNPRGRHGISGRGLLGKWGPNVAADAIVTRRHPKDPNKWQVVSILRKDCNLWALPGGFVDPGETVTVAVKREFTEEAGNVPEDKREEFVKHIDELFNPSNARKVAEVYIEDPRNTDNAWMESTFYHMPCSDELGKDLHLAAGDDAAGVHWIDVDLKEPKFANFYANHAKYVALALATSMHH